MTTLFKNITLIPSGIVLKNFLLIKNSVFDNVPKKHFYLYAIYKYFTLQTKKLNLENAYIIHNHWSAGYHHWITESLTRLISVENYQNKTLVIPENYPKFAFESLRILGLKNINEISPNYKYKLSHLEIPPNPDSGYYKKENLKNLKNTLFKALNLNEGNAELKIYITRKNDKKRKITNEEKLITLLKKYNYKIVDTSTLSFNEQVFLFSKTKTLISIHGAGLTNLLFMPENSHVVEFYKKNTFLNDCYKRMCQTLNINFHRILCNPAPGHENIHVDKSDLVVNMDIFEELLMKIE